MPTPNLYRGGVAIVAGFLLSTSCCHSVLAEPSVASEPLKGADAVDVIAEVADSALIHDGQLLQGRISFGLLHGRPVVNARNIGASRAWEEVEVTPLSLIHI